MFDPDDASIVSMQRAGQIVFDVLAGRRHLDLLATRSPLGADPRIKIDIGFIDVEHFDATPRAGENSVNRGRVRNFVCEPLLLIQSFRMNRSPNWMAS